MKTVDYLIVSYATLPIRRPRSYQIAKLLKHITGTYYLITSDYTTADFLDFSLTSYYSDEDNVVRIYDRSATTIFKILFSALPFLAQYPDRFWLWERSVLRHCTSLSRTLRPKVIVAFARPMRDLLIAMKLKTLFNVPLAVHFADPWVDNPYHSYRGFRKTYNYFLEEKVIKSADLIFFTNSDQRHLVMGKYSPELQAKALTIPHCYDPDLYTSPHDSSGPFLIRHIGNLYKQRGAEPFIEAIHLLKEQVNIEKRVRIEFYGYVSEHLLEMISRYSLSNIVNVFEYVPYLESLKQMTHSNLLLLIDAKSVHNTFFPSKLVDYMGAKQNVLGITSQHGPSARIIKAYGGTVFSHNQVPDISAFIFNAINAPQSFVPNQALMESYSAPVVANRFEQLLKHLAS